VAAPEPVIVSTWTVPVAEAIAAAVLAAAAPVMRSVPVPEAVAGAVVAAAVAG
jgi:hypothetical protein